MEGFIKLHRGLLDSEIFASKIGLKIWIWILLKASYKQRFVTMKIGKGEGVSKLERGELIFGRFSAEETLNIDGSTIYKWIKKMEQMGMIGVKSNSHYTIIKVNNYDTYNSIDNLESSNQVTAKEQQRNSKRTAKEHKQEREESKESKEINIYIPTLNEFLEIAKQKCLDAKINYSELEFSLKEKYNTWKDDGWKDGNKKPIKNWKNKLGNTIPYLKPIRSFEKEIIRSNKLN